MLSYAVLRDIQKKESESAAIVRLEPSFYSEAARLLSEKKSAARESGSILSIKEYENIRKIVAAIQMRREEKIVLMAVRGERDSPGLTAEESQLLKDLSEKVAECRSRVSGIWNGGEEEAAKARKVRILKDIEPYTGLDKAVYGPFRSGEERLLPQAEADWLLKARLAELL
jgi:DNA replication initiation complex subunit (GINS family)